MFIHIYSYSLSMGCLKIGHLRINITLSHLMIRVSVGPWKGSIFTETTFLLLPPLVAWECCKEHLAYSPTGNEDPAQKFSLSLIATIIKILLPETLRVEDPLTALNSFFCLQPWTTQIFPKPSLSVLWGNLRGEGAVGYCLLAPGPRPKLPQGKRHR